MASGPLPDFLSNPLPLVAVVLLAGGLVVKNLPLESSRPDDADRAAPSVRELQGVPARLWQDPFAAVNQAALRTTSSSEITDKSGQTSQSSSRGTRAFSLHEPAALKRMLGWALLSSQGPRTGSPPDEFNTKSEPDEGPVQVLAVMMGTSAFAEQAEERRRTRYATVQALFAAGYLPYDPDGLGYIDTAGLGDWWLPARVPFELYEEESTRGTPQARYVLVLWLEEHAFVRQPLRRLVFLLNALCASGDAPARTGKKASPMRCGFLPPHKGEMFHSKIRLIGPTTSHTLTQMVMDLDQEKWGKRYFRGKMEAWPQLGRYELDVYSPMATASDTTLSNAMLKAGVSPYCVYGIDTDTLPNKSSGDANAKCNIRVHRTVGGDDMLAKMMVGELGLRGVNPLDSRCDDPIVLIAEKDTAYGRELAKSFAEAFSAAEPCVERNNEPQVRPVKSPRVWEFGYLRGLDGIVADGKPTHAPRGAKAPSAKRAETELLEASMGMQEKAEGRGQFDYIRRLAMEIREREIQMSTPTFTSGLRVIEGRSRVKAIGILGNDIYDKLLIMRALRPMFPYAIFFTTDLDARYLHADEATWTRNLLVASNYGFRLPEPLQKNTPPFRTAYQTATYVSTLLALSEASGMRIDHRLHEWRRPRMYEIGRTREILLTSKGGSGSFGSTTLPEGCDVRAPQKCPTLDPTHPGETPQPMHRVYYALVAGAVGYGTVVSLRLARRWRWGIAALVGSAMLAPILGQSFIAAEEPFAWFEGVSVWPSLFIWLLALFSAGYAIWRIEAKFEKGLASIGQRFFGTPPVSGELDSTTDPKDDRSEVEVVAKDFYFAQQALRGWANNWRPFEQMNGGTDTGKKNAWEIYTVACTQTARLFRVVPVVLFFMLIALFWFTISVYALPTRGGAATLACVAICGLAGLLFFLLAQQVVDITRMTCAFVHRLTKHPIAYPAETIKTYTAEFGLPTGTVGAKHEEAIRKWIDFRLVVRLTQEVDQYIYFPFVIAFLVGIAQIRFFDDWQLSLALIIVAGAYLAYTIYFTHALRRSAEDMRRSTLYSYRQCLVKNQVSGESMCGPVKLIEALILKVESEQAGAFRSFMHRPAVQALLLPFGGLGGISLIEYLLIQS